MDWHRGSNVLINNLGGKNYFSVALLPDNSQGTLAKFTQYAYSHVIDTKAEFVYNRDNSEVVTTLHIRQSKEGWEKGTFCTVPSPMEAYRR